jgi:simple sugar transport system permease protein
LVRLEPRRQHSQAMVYLSPVLAILMTLFVGGIIFSFMGKNPFDALYTFFICRSTTAMDFRNCLLRQPRL